MKNRKLLLLYVNLIMFLVLLSACKQNPGDDRDISGVNPVFQPMLNDFQVLYGHTVVNVPIQFSDSLGQNIAGECFVYNNVFYEIKIDTQTWGQIDADAQEALIFHELGHCVLNRGHDTDIMNDGNPNSYMYPYVFMNNGLDSIKLHYNTELFNDPGTPVWNGSGADIDSIKN